MQEENNANHESDSHPQDDQVQLGPPGGINPNLGGGAPGGPDPRCVHQQFPEEKNSESPDQLLIVENADLNKRVEALQSELLALNSRLEEIQAALTEAVTSQQNLEVMLATVSQGKNQAEGDNIQLRQGLEELNNSLVAVSQERDHIASGNVKLHQDLAKLQGTLQAMVAENQLLRNDFEGAMSRTNELGQKLEASKVDIQSLKKQKADLERRMGAQLEEERERSAEARHAKPELEKRVQELQKEVERSARENAQLRKENNKLNEEKGNLDHQLRQAKLHGEDLQKSKEVVRENLLKMTELKEQIEKSQKVNNQKIKELSTKLEALQQENSPLKAQALAPADKKDENQEEVKELRQQLADMKEQHTNQLASMREQLAVKEAGRQQAEWMCYAVVGGCVVMGAMVAMLMKQRSDYRPHMHEPSNAVAVALVTSTMKSAVAQLNASLIPELVQAVQQKIGEFVSAKTNTSSTAARVFEVDDAKETDNKPSLLPGVDNAENEADILSVDNFEVDNAKVVDVSPAQVLDIYNRAVALGNHGKMKQAASRFERLLGLKNNRLIPGGVIGIHFDLGLLYQKMALSSLKDSQEASDLYGLAVKNYEAGVTHLAEGNKQGRVDYICDNLQNIMENAPDKMTGTCIDKMPEVYKYGDTSKILKLYLDYFRYLEDLISKINQKDSVERMRATYQAFKFAKKLASISKRPEYASSKVNLSAAQNFLQSCEQPSTQSLLKKAILKMLKQRGISVPRKKRNDIYALIHSVIQNDLGEPIELAFAMGKNVGDINEPIASFSRGGVIEVVPALHAAAAVGAIESMGAVLRIGADIDKLIYQEESRKAEKDNDQAAISRLSSSGAALHYAATNGKVDSVKFLLKQGARPDIKNFFGFTPKYIADQLGHKEIATLLENAQKVAKEKVERNNDSSATLVGKLGLQGEQQRQRANKNDAGSDDVVRMNNQQMIPKG